jgi:transposase
MPIMETMARKKPRARRSFTPEFKADIVAARRRGDRSIGQDAALDGDVGREVGRPGP